MMNYKKYKRGYFMPPTKCLKWAEKEYIDFEDLITSNLPIYTLDIYEKILLNHLPQLENSIKTEQSINLYK